MSFSGYLAQAPWTLRSGGAGAIEVDAPDDERFPQSSRPSAAAPRRAPDRLVMRI